MSAEGFKRRHYSPHSPLSLRGCRRVHQNPGEAFDALASRRQNAPVLDFLSQLLVLYRLKRTSRGRESVKKDPSLSCFSFDFFFLFLVERKVQAVHVG